jgi:hypothetical protein
MLPAQVKHLVQQPFFPWRALKPEPIKEFSVKNYSKDILISQFYD